MTIDVEAWYHILDLKNEPEFSAWETAGSIIPEGMEIILSLFKQYGVKATFFWLGWSAEHYPELVRSCLTHGHEIATHGYGHRLVYDMTEQEFRHDMERSVAAITSAGAPPPRTYRAPGFSITESEQWVYRILAETGIQIDASVFPGSRGHGGQKNAPLEPYRIDVGGEAIIEVPVSINRFYGFRICLCGGGYFRLFPYWLIRRGFARFDSESRPGVVYLHPREFIPDHPRLKMPYYRYFKSYVNLRTVVAKLRRLFGQFEFTTVSDYVDRCCRDLI
jgi:polysaccharide deacetylase family protein (PEP-CTERM system associated)